MNTTTPSEQLFPNWDCQEARQLTTIVDKHEQFIFLNDNLLYQFSHDDQTQRHFIACLLYLNHNFVQTEIAELFSVSRPTITEWVRLYRIGGLKALDFLPKKPSKLTEENLQRISELKAKKVTNTEIARLLQCNRATISVGLKILAERSTSPELPLDFSESTEKNLSLPISPVEVDETEEVESTVKVIEYQITDVEEDLNPLNRNVDRAFAAAGLLNDADPIFAEHEYVENAGALLAVAALNRDPFLPSVTVKYRRFGASFFGLRNTFMCFFLMAILRIKNINSIEKKNGLKLGRLLGLDRSPCSRTLRRKLEYLTSRGKGMETMTHIAQARVEESSEVEQSVTLHLDGHIHKYSGKGKMSKTFSTSKNRVVKGASDYYLNLPSGTPLIFIPTDFNQSMFEMMPKVLEHAKGLCQGKRLTIIFDRGGSSAKTYETIINADCDFIAYHKSPAPIDDPKFIKKDNEINGVQYTHEPYEQQTALSVKERNGAVYKDTGRTVTLREVVVRKDDGKQVSILTNNKTLSKSLIAETIFKRWAQENYFKYGLEHYNIDALCTYKMEDVTSDIEQANPEYTRSTKNIKTIRKSIASLIKVTGEKIILQKFKLDQSQLDKICEPKKQKKLIALHSTLQEELQFRKTLKQKIPIKDYKKFNDEARIVSNIVKMAAYNIEGKLAKIYAEVSNYKNGNERGIVSRIMLTTGALSLVDDQLRICLETQSTPAKTKELSAFCQKINQMHSKYPGTDLTMQFSVQAG